MSNEYRILPENSPLYMPLPYKYNDFEKISVYCECDPNGIRKLLPSVFEPVSNIVEFFILQNNEIEGLRNYSEGGVVIPCKYKNIVGGHVAFEWVTTDDALCAGREIWGYPKKLGEVTFDSNETGAVGTISRNGAVLFVMEINYKEKNLELPSLQPRLIVKRILNSHNDELSIDQVIMNQVENSRTSIVKTAEAKITINTVVDDPIHVLNPSSVIGGQYIRGEFLLTYGRLVEDFLESQ